jgi:enamine deaminase RidA (YjgF/YER057c/UK114 family)
MSSKTPVLTSKAPKPLPGIYSQAIKAGDFVFVSGAVPMDPVTMEIIKGDIQDHTVSAYISPPSRGLPTSSFHQARHTS